MVRQLLSIAFDLPWVFALLQKLGASTASIYEDLIRRHLSAPPGTQVLDIGCGIGAHRKLFWEQNYLGVDISASRIELASRRYGAVFEVMDASKLDVRDTSVDLALCVATFHHVDANAAAAMVQESWRVLRAGGSVHIIDVVIPYAPKSWMKRWVLANDGGRFPRTELQLRALVERVAPIAVSELVLGRLHNVLYLRLDKS